MNEDLVIAIKIIFVKDGSMELRLIMFSKGMSGRVRNKSVKKNRPFSNKKAKQPSLGDLAFYLKHFAFRPPVKCVCLFSGNRIPRSLKLRSSL